MSSWDVIDGYLTRVYDVDDVAAANESGAPLPTERHKVAGAGDGGQAAPQKPPQKPAPGTTVAAVRQLTSPLDRLGDHLAQAPMPGGIGGPLAALALLTLAIVPVQTVNGRGMSRLQLLWLVLAGSVALAPGDPNAAPGDGGIQVRPSQPSDPNSQPGVFTTSAGSGGGQTTLSAGVLADLSAAGISFNGGQYRGGQPAYY